MLKSKIVPVAIAAAIAFAPLSATAQFRAPGGGVFGGSSTGNGALILGGCVISIMIAAVDKGNKYKKELTTDEAITCGLLYWVREANKKR